MAYRVSAIAQALKRRTQPAAALPPMGSYSPDILLQYGANNRLAQNAQQTFDLSQAQAQDDFGINTNRLAQAQGNTLGDLGLSNDRQLTDLAQNRDRSLADILQGRSRATQDAATATADLQRNYSRLGQRQDQAARQAHVESAGILAQSLAARQGNLAHDQAPIDQGLSRLLSDSQTSQDRLTQDYATQTGRVGQDFQTNTGRAKQSYDQQKADLALNLTRGFGSGVGGSPLGSQTLGLQQTKQDAISGNLDLSGVAYQQAAANGYRIVPKRKVPMVV